VALIDKEEFKNEMVEIAADMYNKGAISILETLKKFVELQNADITKESILEICNCWIDNINKK
jgi:hypothetical protein